MSNIVKIKNLIRLQKKSDHFFEVRGKEKAIEAKHDEVSLPSTPEVNWRKEVASKEQKALQLKNQVNRELIGIQMRKFT